jgi:uncharacterized membrane protein (DUF485 family)
MSLMSFLYSELYGIAAIVVLVMAFVLCVWYIKKLNQWTNRLDEETKEIENES